jgi:hypothetical protein
MNFSKITVKYVLKIDDDGVPNIPKLLKYLDERISYDFVDDLVAEKFICFNNHYMKVVRNKSSKFYLSRTEYPSDIFPDYCVGLAYIATFGVARRISRMSSFTNYLKFEDAYVTGYLRQQMHSESINIEQFYYMDLIDFKASKPPKPKDYVNRYLFIWCASNIHADFNSIWHLFMN